MSEKRLHKLGDYFVHFDIRNRFGITFEHFIYLNDRGLWKEWLR
jgi:hypothetical protein